MSFTLSGGKPTVEVSASAWVSSQTDTTATITVQANAWMVYSGSWVQSSGVVAKATGNGSSLGSKTIFGNGTEHSGTGTKSVTFSFSVNKGSSSKSVSWSVAFHSYIDGTDLGKKDTKSGSVSITAITYYAPNAPTNCTNARNSDTKNTVSWTAPSTSTTKPVSSIKVERSIDGGSWSEIASVGATATSYSDTSTSADHCYQYRVRSYNTAGYSSYATSGTTYNTPSAPTSITASRLAETKVSLSIANAARTATALEVQRSTNQSNWEDVATISGSSVTAAEDEPGGGTFWYRARNTRGNLVSAWSATSNAVVTICAPNAPTLVAPASGVTVSMATLAIPFSWKHSPVDGSAQTAAELRYRAVTDATAASDDIAWTTVMVSGGSQSVAVDNSFEVNSIVTWGVRTKGTHEDFGPWSSNRVFYLRQQPSVSFAEPDAGFVVENTPIHVKLQYEDASGTLANAALTIRSGTTTVYALDMGTSTEADILADDWLPDNGASYSLHVAVRSSSTLTATASRDITVDFILPKPAYLDVRAEEDTGYASISVGVDEGEGMVEPVSMSVYRVTEGGRILLGSDLGAGSGLIDRYAPLNTDYVYEAVSFADSGAINVVTFQARIDSSWAYVYFTGGIARGMWNPQTTYDIEPSYKLVHYAGRKYPVGYMRDNLAEAHTVKVTLMERDEARAFRRMADACEPVVAKTWDGLVFHAIPVLKFAPVSGTSAYWGEISVGLDRIDGDAL